MARWQSMVPYVLEMEGGISDHPSDPAAADPAPGLTGPAGRPAHTNKGVTWGTFKYLAPKIGYTPTVALFAQMPDNIWLKIMKTGYWDAVKGDEIASDAIALTLTDWGWGSGPGTAVREVQKVLNAKHGASLTVDGGIGPATLEALNRAAKRNESQLFDDIHQARVAFHRALPQAPEFPGWFTRLDAFYDRFAPAAARRRWWVFGIGVAVLATVFGVVYYKYSND